MFDRIRKWFNAAPPPDPPQGPLAQLQENDWVVVPYRVAEACRMSIYTIGAHPDLPDELRLWIAQWLVSYNGALALWFQENYGPDIFKTLEQITDTVRDVSEHVYAEDYHEAVAADFDRWQEELREQHGDG